MEPGEIKQFPIFEMTSQNTNTSGGGGNRVLFIYIRTTILWPSTGGRNILTTSATSKFESPESCTSVVLSSIPKACHISEIRRAGIGSAP